MILVSGRSLIRAGIATIRSHLVLALLLYGVSAALSLTFSALFVDRIQEIIALSGFAEELARGMDWALWGDIVVEHSEVLLSQAHHLLWLLPLSILWKAAASVGLLHRFKGLEESFWHGARRYVVHSLLMGVLFYFLALVLSALAIALVLLPGLFWQGEVASFWLFFVAAPGAAVVVISACTVMRDVARGALVVTEQSFFQAVACGIRALLRHRGIWLLFAVCVLLGVMLTVVVVLAESGVPVVVRFAGVQLIQLAVSAIIVGWYGGLACYVRAVCAQPRV